MTLVDPESLRRRLRAARAIADLTVEQLAAELGAGLGAKTLYNVESGAREVRPMELREIATACELPYEFFTVDFARLPEIAAKRDDPARSVEQMQMTELARRLDRVEQALGVDVTDEQRATAAAALEAELEDAAQRATERDQDNEAGEDAPRRGRRAR